MSSAHQGHRQRLRESILAGQLEDLGEIDFLEMLLTYAIPRKDVRPIAEQLMQRFLNLPGVLSATPRSLRRVNGVGEVTVAFLKLVDRIRSLPRNGQPFPPLVIETGSSPTMPLALSPEEPESAVNSNETDPQVRSRSGRSVTREAKLLITNPLVQPPETDTRAILEQQPAQPPRTSQTRKRRPKGRGHEEVAPSQKINRQEILAGFSIPDGSSPTRDSPTEVAPKPSKKHEVIRAIQDLIWKEALLSLPWSEKFEDIGEFQHYIREHLPQNSLSTRDRYAQTVVRWFYPDGLKGLTAKVWRHYQDPGLAEEILRYRYLCAETMAGASWPTLFSPSVRMPRFPIRTSCSSSGNGLARQYRIRRRNGSRRISASSAFSRLEKSDVIYYVPLLRRRQLFSSCFISSSRKDSPVASSSGL